MAVTYGFYNSLNKDRMYNAEQMSSIFNGIITDGVFSTIGDALMTVAGTGMQVIVKSGRAWFNSTWTLNDAQLPLDVPAADVSMTRIDAVILEVNSAISARANSIKVLKGTPSANPAKPALSATETLHQYALAYITVGAGVTSITAANIEINVGKTSCPFITSVLQQTDITDLFNQWEAEFTAWFENVQAQLSGNVAANLQRQIDANKSAIEKHWNDTLLPATKTRFGLDSDAIPDDAFNNLYNYIRAVIPSGYGIFMATVKDSDGNIVPYVKISISGAESKNLQSDSNGVVQSNLKVGSYTLSINEDNRFATANPVAFSVTEKDLISKIVTINVVKSGKIYVTEASTVIIPKFIQKYDLCIVGGGGGGGCCAYTRSNYFFRAAGGGGGGIVTNKPNNIISSDHDTLVITIGAGGASGEDGETTTVKVNSKTISSAGGTAGKTAKYNGIASGMFTPEGGSGGSAGGSAIVVYTDDDDSSDVWVSDLCLTSGRENGASALPLVSSDIQYPNALSNSYFENLTATGQGSSTREFGDEDGILYGSGGGAAYDGDTANGGNGYSRITRITNGGSGAGNGKRDGTSNPAGTFTSGLDASAYGCGGGGTVIVYSRNDGNRAGEGKQGVVVIRWNIA